MVDGAEAVKLDLFAIGEVMAEIRREPELGFRVGFAGDTFNTAVYCARQLGASGRVGYCTRIGLDPLSEAFLATAAEEHLEVSHVARDRERFIGIYTVSTDAAGERSFHYWRSSSAARELFSSGHPMGVLPEARIVFVSGITLAILHPPARRRLIDHLRTLRERGGGLVAFDSNYRPQLWKDAETARRIIGEMWEVADVALPSMDDEMALFGDVSEDAVVARFGAGSWSACAIKRGARGPVSPHLAGDAHPRFRPASRVVDTTAAGDSFNGGYLAAYLCGQDERQCLLAGHEIAARVVGSRGAILPRS